jgi:hypothetical protein
MKYKRKNKLKLQRKRKFYIGYRYKRNGEDATTSITYKINRTMINVEWVEAELKRNNGYDSVVILSCFEVGLNNHKKT